MPCCLPLTDEWSDEGATTLAAICTLLRPDCGRHFLSESEGRFVTAWICLR